MSTHRAARLLLTVLLLAFARVDAVAGAERRVLMQRLADHWVGVQLPDGSLPYGYDFLPDTPAEPTRSSWHWVVRQAGSLYLLAEYYRFSGDPRLRDTARRGLMALRAHSLPIGKAPAQAWIEATRILSLPFARWKLRATLDRLGLLYRTAGPGMVISPDGRYDTALTGATALALLAELAYSRASGDNGFADLGAAWLQGLASLRIPGAGFRATPTTIDDSDYFNGEAWFALAVYADTYRDDARVVSMLAELEPSLMDRYNRAPKAGFHQWGLMAAARRLAATGDARYLDFLHTQTRLFFERFARTLDPAANNCAEMEGAAAALASFERAGERDTELAAQTRAWLGREAAKLTKLQIQPGQTGLALGGDAYLRAPRMASFAGTFLIGLTEPSVRLDVDAHCLSALMALERDALVPSAD